MAFPTDIDNFTPKVDNVDDVNAVDVNELQTAIESLEAKVGANSSAVTSSHDYKISALETKTAKITNASSSAPASIYLAEDTDNGTNKITITAPSAVASDKVLTLPDATDTLVGKDTTDTLTNKNLSSSVKLDANADQNITQYGMARQAIMNGNFDVWQRGTSTTAITNEVYDLFDRWQRFASADSGTFPTATQTKQTLTSGDIIGSFYHYRCAVNGAGTSLGVNSFFGIRQKIENGTRNLCGLNKKVTVSFWARSSITNKRICPTLYQTYGTGGSPSATEIINGTPITLTSSWVKYTATFTTNTLVGKTFGTNGDDSLQLNLWHLWGTTIGNSQVQTSVTAETFVGAGNIDIAQVQLCAGDVALPFQPKSFEEELRACQRYYEKIGGVIQWSKAASSYARSMFPWSVVKRITPTCTIKDSAGTTAKYSSVTAADVVTAGKTPIAFTPGEQEFFIITAENTDTGTSLQLSEITAEAEL